MILCNHHATIDAIVDVFVVPSGNSTGDANQILKNLTIVASDTFVMDMEKLILANGDFIVVKSNAANVVNSVISSMAVA